MSSPNYSQILDDIRKQSNVLRNPCLITGISYHDACNQPVFSNRSTTEITGDTPGHWTSEMKLSYKCIHEPGNNPAGNLKTFTGKGNMKKSSRFDTCRQVVQWWVKYHPKADQITNKEVEALIAKRKLENPSSGVNNINGPSTKKQRKNKKKGEGSGLKNPTSNPTLGLTLEMANYLLLHAKDIPSLCVSYGIQLNEEVTETSTNPSFFNASLSIPDANGQIDVLGTGIGATQQIAISVAYKSVNKNRLAEHMARLLPPPLTSIETLVETVQRTVTSDPDEFAKWLLHFSQDQAHYCSSSSSDPSEHAHGTWVIGIEIEGSRPHKTIGTIQVAVDGAVIIYSLHGSQWPTVPEGTQINYGERLPAIFLNILQCPKFYKLVGGGFVQPMLQELISSNLQGMVHVGDVATKLGYEKKCPQSKLSVGLTGLQSKKRNSFRVNWNTFPLTDEMITYATADVLLTFQIGASLSRRLRALESLSSDQEETKETITTWIDCPSITAVVPLELPQTITTPTTANITLPPPPSQPKPAGPPAPSGRRGEGRRRGDPYRRPRLSRAEEEDMKRFGRLPPPGVPSRRGRSLPPLDEYGRPLPPPPGPPGRYPPPPPPPPPRDRDYYRPRSPPNPWRSIDVSRDPPPSSSEVIHLPRLTPGQPLQSVLSTYRQSEHKSSSSYVPPPPPPPPTSSTYSPYRPPSPPHPSSSSPASRSAASYYQTISTYTNSTSFRSPSPPRSSQPPTTSPAPLSKPKSPIRYTHQEPTLYPPKPTTSAPPPPPHHVPSSPLYLPPGADYRGGSSAYGRRPVGGYQPGRGYPPRY